MQSDCEYMQNIMRRINAGSGESNTVNTRGETQDQTDGIRWDTELCGHVRYDRVNCESIDVYLPEIIHGEETVS